jgi:hypothetical protein
MRRIASTTTIALALLGASLAFAGPASAVFTIGSDLDHDPNQQPNCGTPCTYIQGSLISANTAPSGLTSPVNGTVVRFRVKYHGPPPATPINFRVIRPTGGGLYTGAGTSSPLSPPMTVDPAIYALETSLPIKAGESIGVDCCTGAEHNIMYRPPGVHVAEGSVLSWVAPSLADGSMPRASNNGDSDLELLANADIEPANTFTVDSVTPGKGAATIVVTVPNPGTLIAGDATDQGFVARAAAKGKGKKKKKRKKKPPSGPLLERATATATAAGPVTLTLTASAAGQAKLKPPKAKKGKGKKKKKGKRKAAPLSVPVKITYTPTGGTARTEQATVTLQP